MIGKVLDIIRKAIIVVLTMGAVGTSACYLSIPLTELRCAPNAVALG